MEKMVDKIAKTVEEAVNEALLELNATREEVDIEVLEEPTKGILGLGAKPALVRVMLKVKEEVKEDKKEKVKEIITNITGCMGLSVTSDIKEEEEVIKVDINGDWVYFIP
jgi:spoIIIJ-associated protein